jgi:S-ribosylhomocysteine lyase LuxS involved in autoinducer biosynthesis
MAAAAVVNAKKQIMFSADAVTDHLVRFIAANDQVMSTVPPAFVQISLIVFSPLMS